MVSYPLESWIRSYGLLSRDEVRQRPPGGTYFVSQANTSLCQYALLAGFSTQWPSSGKLINFDGTPCRCERGEQLMALARPARGNRDRCG